MGLELEAWGVWVSRARADGVANERVATCQLHHVIVVVVVVIVFWGRERARWRLCDNYHRQGSGSDLTTAPHRRLGQIY